MTEGEVVIQLVKPDASQEASLENDGSLEMLMVKEDAVEAVLQALDRGASVGVRVRSCAVRAHGARPDPKLPPSVTVQALQHKSITSM